MRYTISRGSAHSSLSLDVGVAATPIPHSNPISLYTTDRQKFKILQIQSAAGILTI